MRYFLLSLVLLTSSLAIAQCDAVADLLRQGDELLQAQPPNYTAAINAYTAVMVACPEQAGAARQRISNMVQDMNKLRERASASAHQAQIVLDTLKAEQQRAQEALAESNKLVNSFHFYADRFALAYGNVKRKGRLYYFIDKQGQQVEKLGEWARAEQFDDLGFAHIWKQDDPQPYLMDTLGKMYPVAYSLENIGTHITALDLSGQALKKVPKGVGQLLSLEVLILGNNSISVLQEHIGDLTNLQILDLSRNSLISLPESIGELMNLQRLDLRHNSLVSLPKSVGNLADLQLLYLRKNSLSSLPEQLGDLSNLQLLDLSSNSLISLPERLGNLRNLKSLYLNSNSLSSLPEDICDLAELNYLVVDGNPLDSLPATVLQSGLVPLNDIIALLNNKQRITYIRHISNNIQNAYDFSRDDLRLLTSLFLEATVYEGAIWTGEAYCESGGSGLRLRSKLALAYLCNGQEETARTTYEVSAELKETNRESAKELFLKDLERISNYGQIDPELVARTKTFLENW